MDRLTSRILLLTLVALGIALAGCTGNQGKTNDTPSTSTPPSTATGETMLASALASPPARFHVDLAFYKGTDKVATSQATYLNDSRETYVVVSGALLNMAAASGLPRAQSVEIYVGPTGMVGYANGTALVFPPENASAGGASALTAVRGGGFGAFLSGPGALAYLQGDQIHVTSVESSTCAGQPATRVTFNHTVQNQANVAVADLVGTNPPRLCHLETTMPTRANAQADPLNGANVRADFLYESQVPAIPASVKAPLGLLYEKTPATDPKHAVWTFKGASGRALADVQLEVKEASGSQGFFVNPTVGATRWSATLDQLPKTQDGVTLNFADNDHDGKVSAGDTLTLDTTGDALPPVAMKDLTTGAYVVPGPALVLGLVALGLAALAMRRR